MKTVCTDSCLLGGNTNRRVLLIQDDWECADLITATLAGTGWNVTTVPHGLSAMAAIGALDPDLVMVDTNLPYYPGHTVISSCASRHPDLPLIGIGKSEQRCEQAVSAGAWLAISRPIDESELHRACELALARRDLDSLGALLACSDEQLEAAC